MRKLFAFFENKKVGTLIKNEEDVYSFEYEASWQKNPFAFPISLSMPLTEKTFGNRVTLSFFENLLPEGEVRRDLESSHKIHGVFDFLAEFGKDCAGAIFLTKEALKPTPIVSMETVPIAIEKVYTAIDEKQSVADVISDMGPGYLSLAGAQDKFPAIFRDEEFFLPKAGAPTTHIIKAPIWRHGVKDSVYNEYYCMELARNVGMEVPKCQVKCGPSPLFIVERYDRVRDKKNRVHRIHQQDLCQAQGYPSENKYEIRNGPSLAQNYKFLRSIVSPQFRLESLERFLNWISFNLIIGNNDSHSKNLSLLLIGKEKYKFAPHYDLMSTAVYPRLEKRFSFKIGDRDEFSKIGKNQIERLEDQIGIKRGVFKKKLRTMSEKINEQKNKVAQTVESQISTGNIIKQINKLIQDRIKSLSFQKAID